MNLEVNISTHLHKQTSFSLLVPNALAQFGLESIHPATFVLKLPPTGKKNLKDLFNTLIVFPEQKWDCTSRPSPRYRPLLDLEANFLKTKLSMPFTFILQPYCMSGVLVSLFFALRNFHLRQSWAISGQQISLSIENKAIKLDQSIDAVFFHAFSRVAFECNSIGFINLLVLSTAAVFDELWRTVGLAERTLLLAKTTPWHTNLCSLSFIITHNKQKYSQDDHSYSICSFVKSAKLTNNVFLSR